MNSARDRKIRANNKVEQLIKDVFIKRPITNLVETSYGFRACFGLKKDGTPDKRRLGKDRAIAKEIKEQWNRALAKGDQTTANAITTLTAINTAKAVELMRETPFEILDAVEFFLEHGMPPTVITVAEAMDIFMDYQRQRENRPTSTDEKHSNFRTFYKPFKEHFSDRKLISLTTPLVDKYFKRRGKNWNAKTWNSHRGRLMGLWNVLADKQYCSKALNPFENIVEKREPKSSTRTKVSTVKNVELFFHWLEKECEKYPSKYPELALSVVTFFCGVRVEEVSRVSWNSIDKKAEHIGEEEQKDFSGWTITVYDDDEKSNVSKINPIPINAQHWIELIEDKTKNIKIKDSLTAGDWRQRKKRLWVKFHKEESTKLPQNTARHTWASMHLALYANSNLTALRMGHKGNPETLLNTYTTSRQKPSEAIKYFNIVPNTVDPKVLQERQDNRDLKMHEAKVRANREQNRIANKFSAKALEEWKKGKWAEGEYPEVD